MADTATGILIETMHDWGVDVVFGLPGDGINGITEALRTRQDRVRFVQVRHEEAAAFMACAYAKFTGVRRERAVDSHLPGAGDQPRGFRVQPIRRRAPRRARSEVAHAVTRRGE
jgi:hypothetical protein